MQTQIIENYDQVQLKFSKDFQVQDQPQSNESSLLSRTENKILKKSDEKSLSKLDSLIHSKDSKQVSEIEPEFVIMNEPLMIGQPEQQFLQKKYRSKQNESSKSSQKRKYICPVDGCGKKFLRSSNLKTHELVHTGERPFKCEVCFKCFQTNQNLDVHSRTHTGEKPFLCYYPQCCKRFSSGQSLIYHHNREHGGTYTSTKVSLTDPKFRVCKNSYNQDSQLDQKSIDSKLVNKPKFFTEIVHQASKEINSEIKDQTIQMPVQNLTQNFNVTPPKPDSSSIPLDHMPADLQLFLKDQISYCQKESPDFKLSAQLLKVFHQLWQKMSPEEKLPFQKKTAFQHFSEEFSKKYGNFDEKTVLKFWEKLNQNNKAKYDKMAE